MQRARGRLRHWRRRSPSSNRDDRPLVDEPLPDGEHVVEWHRVARHPVRQPVVDGHDLGSGPSGQFGAHDVRLRPVERPRREPTTVCPEEGGTGEMGGGRVGPFGHVAPDRDLAVGAVDDLVGDDDVDRWLPRPVVAVGRESLLERFVERPTRRGALGIGESVEELQPVAVVGVDRHAPSLPSRLRGPSRPVRPSRLRPRRRRRGRGRRRWRPGWPGCSRAWRRAARGVRGVARAPRPTASPGRSCRRPRSTAESAG